MAQAQPTTENEAPITYPDRIYNGKDFDTNINNEQSSDNLTTVLTDKNEVLGFPDQTSKQEMQAAIEADRNGSISTYKPSFFDKFIAEPLRQLGMASFQPPFVTDIKPTPERAFATSMARAATADVFKPESSEQEAKAYPMEAMAGGLVGGLASFATGGALLDGFKLAQLTPFAEGIIKTGLMGGAYRGVAETANQLRDSDHPDLAKIGEGVLHDTLWFGAMGATAPLAKAANVAASAGLGYLMAKTDGQDEPSALLNGALFGGIQMLHAHGDNPDVREPLVNHVQQAISDYIMAKNPLVHPEVANQAGREMISNYAEGVLQRRAGLQETGIETPQAKEIEQKFQRPEVPIEDGYDPKLLDYLSQYIPADRLVRMSGTDRVALGKAPESDLESYKQQYEQMGQIQAGEKAEANKPIVPEVEKMISEGGPVNVLNELPKSKILLTQTISSIAKDVYHGTGNQIEGEDGGQRQGLEPKEGEQDVNNPANYKTAEDLTKEWSDANSGGESLKEGSEQTPGLVGQEKEGVRVRDNEKAGVEAKSGEEVVAPTKEGDSDRVTSKIAKSIEQKAVDAKLTDKFPTLAGEEKVNVEEQSKMATDLVNNKFDDARAIIRGEKPLPERLKGISLVTAMEEHLRNNPNADIAHELANSDLVAGTTRAAQELRLAAEREPDSFTQKYQELKRALIDSKGGDEKVAKTKKAIIKAANAEFDKMNLSDNELGKLDDFFKGIEC